MILESVRLALRISHSKLDTDILDAIDAAKKEIERVGVDPLVIIETDPLILDAIKTYCKYSFSSDLKMREGFFNSFQYQIDCLRKSTGYKLEVVEIV